MYTREIQKKSHKFNTVSVCDAQYSIYVKTLG